MARHLNMQREETDWYTTPCYEGKDTHLKEKPYCYSCKGAGAAVSNLKRCSRCQVAWYCGAQCQKEHFKAHRKLCKRVAEDTKRVEQEAIPLRNWSRQGQEVTENLFETRLGRFSGHEVLNYLAVRASLADAYWDAGYDFEVKEVWEKSLSHYLEFLRLDARCPRQIRFRLPYILLYLNRGDEAYSFIRCWLKFDDFDDNEIFSRHARSKEGDWIYPIEPNCRYHDIYEECRNIQDLPEAAPYMVALAIIKMRIVASNDAVSQLLDFVFKETDAKRIQEVQPLVQAMLVGSSAANQRQQLDRLFERMHPFTLTALHNYEEVFFIYPSVGLKEVTEHYPFPINLTLVTGLRAFFRVPGAPTSSASSSG